MHIVAVIQSYACSFLCSSSVCATYRHSHRHTDLTMCYIACRRCGL